MSASQASSPSSKAKSTPTPLSFRTSVRAQIGQGKLRVMIGSFLLIVLRSDRQQSHDLYSSLNLFTGLISWLIVWFEYITASSNC